MLSFKKNNSYVSKSFIALISTLLLASFSTSTSAAEPLNIQSITFIKDKAAVNDKVRAECKLLEKTKKFLIAYGKKHFKPVTTESKAVAGAYNLTAQIVATVGGAGGSWTGRKGATIKGTLKKDGKVVGTYEAFRSSGGRRFGWGGGFGTCSLLGRSVKTLSSDITKWARKPSANARLGELK